MKNGKIIESFHLMWDNFPEPVMLIHKTREILAVNKTGQNAGGSTGLKCSSIGSPDNHKGCQANQALASQQAKYTKADVGGKEIIAYWLPVPGHSDIYVHFGVGTMVDYDKCKS